VKRTNTLLTLLLLIAAALGNILPAAAQTPPLPADIGDLSLSAGGRFLAFLSAVDELVEGDTNGLSDAFVLDRLTMTLERVSISTTGEQSDAPIESPRISANGRFVAFLSTATTLVPNGTAPETPVRQVYIHDRLTGLTERISVNERGEPGNADSSGVSISADGRYVAFQSLADNLVRGDTNQVADVFIRDRLTQHTIRVSMSSRGAEGNAPSGEQFTLSGDGRIVAYTSQAATLAISFDAVPRIYRYQRVLAQTSYHNLPVDDRKREVLQLALSHSGGVLAALTLADASDYEVLLFSPDANLPTTLTTFPRPADQRAAPAIALSADGQTLLLLTPQGEVRRYDLAAEAQSTLLRETAQEIALAPGEDVIAYLPEQGEESLAFYQAADAQLGFTLSGRVADPTGQPLALVTIRRANGESTRTDQHGYFFFSGVPAGEERLIPEKEGFTFEPESLTFTVEGDQQSLDFTVRHEKVLEEARADLGMPYSFDRGESGPFHGYTAGYCTDLVLDAYTFGAEYNIQFALEQDYRAHPEHVYRWRDARDAFDMWRYLSYSGQMLPHAAPYQPGDIVFFDWSEDGEIDHVAVISEVTAENRPKKMYDATGVIDSNPSGLAAELPWEAFHERTVRGHARWSGAFEPVIPQMPGGTFLQIAVGSSGLRAQLIGPQEQVLSQSERALPGGVFFDLGWEQSLSLSEPLAVGEAFTLEIHNPSAEAVPFVLLAQTTQDGLVVARVEHRGELAPGETFSLPLTLALDEEGRLSLTAPTLTPP